MGRPVYLSSLGAENTMNSIARLTRKSASVFVLMV